MANKIVWIGAVAFGVETEGGTQLGFSLEEGQTIPPEFKEGDLVDIVNRSEHPAVLAMGMDNGGYYEFRHVPTGIVYRTWHRADSYKVEEK